MTKVRFQEVLFEILNNKGQFTEDKKYKFRRNQKVQYFGPNQDLREKDLRVKKGGIWGEQVVVTLNGIDYLVSSNFLKHSAKKHLKDNSDEAIIQTSPIIKDLI